MASRVEPPHELIRRRVYPRYVRVGDWVECPYGWCVVAAIFQGGAESVQYREPVRLWVHDQTHLQLWMPPPHRPPILIATDRPAASD